MQEKILPNQANSTSNNHSGEVIQNHVTYDISVTYLINIKIKNSEFENE